MSYSHELYSIRDGFDSTKPYDVADMARLDTILRYMSELGYMKEHYYG